MAIIDGVVIQDRVRAIVEPSLTDLGYGVVRVRFTGGGRACLQIMAERLDGVAMSIDDCSEISHVASALLDVEDPITGAYQLEVSSPGIDRPLVRRADFERFRGFEVRIETRHPVAGRKRFKGLLEGLGEDDMVRVTETPETLPGKPGKPPAKNATGRSGKQAGTPPAAAVLFAIPFDAIAKARLEPNAAQAPADQTAADQAPADQVPASSDKPRIR